MDSKTLKTLEYDKVLGKVRSFAVSACAKEAVLSLTPYKGEDIKRALNEVEQAYKVKYVFGVNPIEEFDDCVDICEKAQKGAMLSPAELTKVKNLLRSGRVAQASLNPYECDLLKLYTRTYFIDRGTEEEIDRSIADNEVCDAASGALKDIRRKILEKKNSLKERLSSYFRKSEYSKFLQDNLVTVRGDRFVLPVKSEYRSSVPGLIHDMSASGATVFIEPFAVVETNNEIKSLTLQEAAEVERILFALSERVAQNAENILKIQQAVMWLDVIFAKMNYSADINGTMPMLVKDGSVCLKEARHPLIDKNSVVPVDISLGKDYKILMITGPNTGGKTVSLKTVGLVCLMAYTGIFIPCAEGSEVAVFDKIFCDIGDEQSIAESLSTFSSHIVNLIRITEQITSNTLLLFDELGGGTDPQEGAALAIGIIKYIESKSATAIITTHYGELKEYALASPHISNAAMQFDSVTLKPTYRLIGGIPGTSNALSIAEALGLNKIILRYAVESMNEGKIGLENLIKSAEQLKNKSLEELAATEKLKEELVLMRAELLAKQKQLDEKLEKINFGAKTEIKRLVSAGVEKADELIEQLKEKIKQADEKALLEAKALRKQLENMAYEAEADSDIPYEELKGELKVGDRVYVKSLRSVGTVVSVDKKKEAEISLGSIKTKIKISELAKPIETPPKKKEKKAEYKPSAPIKQNFITPEVNILGCTVSEGIEIVEPHLIALAGEDGAKIFRIVHGKGTGALGRGIQQYLKTSPYVKSYRYGGYGEGDNGVTIVEIK